MPQGDPGRARRQPGGTGRKRSARERSETLPALGSHRRTAPGRQPLRDPWAPREPRLQRHSVGAQLVARSDRKAATLPIDAGDPSSDHPQVAAFTPERWPPSRRNPWPASPGIRRLDSPLPISALVRSGPSRRLMRSSDYRGDCFGAQCARMTLQPFRSSAAARTMAPVSPGSTRLSGTM